MAIAAGVGALAMAGAFALWPGRVGVGRRLRVLWQAEEGKEAKPEKPRTSDPLDIASVFDLLAACLRAGLPMADAARAVAAGAPRRVAAHVEVGAVAQPGP
ncbi:type II secretion system F family protein, partial [Nocardia xishanensis]